MEKENYYSLFVCSPKNFKMITPINYTEQKTFQSGIDVQKLVAEHERFCDLLHTLGIFVVHLPPLKNCPQQTFVRDLGFSLHDTLYVGQTREPMRAGEQTALLRIIDRDGLPFYKFNHFIEGGDVLFFGRFVFVGLSGRTNADSIEELKKVIPSSMTVVPVPIAKKFLHLDTVLNGVGDTLVYNPNGFQMAFDPYQYTKKVLAISPLEQPFLATNFIALNDHTVLSNKKCIQLNTKLRQNGIVVFECEFDEMLKLGGSFRCCTLEIPFYNK